MFSTSNFSRLGPAITPTTANKTIAATPAAAAEGWNPPIAKVAKRFMKLKASFGVNSNGVYKLMVITLIVSYKSIKMGRGLSTHCPIVMPSLPLKWISFFGI